MLVEVKKQIPGTPARRARRHALSSFDQLNKAERERLGKINPLHKRYDLYIVGTAIGTGDFFENVTVHSVFRTLLVACTAFKSLLAY